MRTFGFFKGKPASNTARVEKLTARLADPNKKGRHDGDQDYGFHEDEKIIDELEKIGDPTAIPALIAKEESLAGFLKVMAEVYDIAPTLKAVPGQLDKDRRLYQYVSKLREKTRRVIAVLDLARQAKRKEAES